MDSNSRPSNQPEVSSVAVSCGQPNQAVIVTEAAAVAPEEVVKKVAVRHIQSIVE